MNVKLSILVCAACCIALLTTGCSLTREGKASKKIAEAKQAELAKQMEEKRPKMSGKWESIDSDLVGVEYLFDKESIMFPSADTIYVWRKKTFPDNAPQKTIISLDEIDCRNQKYRMLQSQAFRRDGTATEMFMVISPWMTIYQASADEYLLDNYCKKEKRSEGKGK